MTTPTSIPPVAPAITLGGVAPSQDATPWSFCEKLHEDFTLPTDLYTAAIRVVNSSRYAVNMPLSIGGRCTVLVMALLDATHIQVKRLTGAAGYTIRAGQPINPCAAPEAAAADTSRMYDFVASPFAIPSVDSEVTLSLKTGGWVEEGMILYFHKAGWFRVTSVSPTDSKTITVANSELLAGLTTTESVFQFNAAPGSVVLKDTPVWPEVPGRGVRYNADHFTVTNEDTALPGGAKVSLKQDPTLALMLHAAALAGAKIEYGEVALSNAVLTTPPSYSTLSKWAALTSHPTFRTAFTAAPLVFLFQPDIDTIGTAAYNLRYYFMQARTVSTTGFEVWGQVYSSPAYLVGANTTAKIKWIAIGA